MGVRMGWSRYGWNAGPVGSFVPVSPCWLGLAPLEQPGEEEFTRRVRLFSKVIFPVVLSVSVFHFRVLLRIHEEDATAFQLGVMLLALSFGSLMLCGSVILTFVESRTLVRGWFHTFLFSFCANTTAGAVLFCTGDELFRTIFPEGEDACRLWMPLSVVLVGTVWSVLNSFPFSVLLLYVPHVVFLILYPEIHVSALVAFGANNKTKIAFLGWTLAALCVACYRRRADSAQKSRVENGHPSGADGCPSVQLDRSTSWSFWYSPSPSGADGCPSVPLGRRTSWLHGCPNAPLDGRESWSWVRTRTVEAGWSGSSAGTAILFEVESSHGSSDSDFNSDSGTVNLRFNHTS
jgi:hypothetical protein